MRYLWVEDFNDEGNEDTKEELRERLEEFFDLQNDKIIKQEDLSSAIKFLEDKENFDEIDAVLIDIRFPEGDESKLYDKYFRNIVTRKFYTNNIEDASGILMYLLLVFRYHISQQKIAFISANISSDNNKLKTIQEMSEIIIKSKYRNLSDADKKRYREVERKLGSKILNISRQEKDWDTFIEKDDSQVENIDVDKLLRRIRLLPIDYPEKFEQEDFSNQFGSAQLKFNTVKKQFDKIGFIMPAAFEKPRIGEKKEKRYSFMLWEEELYMNPYNAIRSNVQEMCIILIDYFERYKSSHRIYSDFLNLLTCNQEEKNSYDETFFTRYLKYLKETFRFDFTENTENIEVYCERELKEITALWEASARPEYKVSNNKRKRNGMITQKGSFEHGDKCYYACHAVLKIIRNWTGHQGIKNIGIIDVGLIFLLNMRGLFDIDNLPEEYIHKYIECEDNILSMYEADTEATEEISESFTYFCRLNNATRKGNNLSQEIYDKISGLGHFQSKIRREVSMDDIYMLLYHLLSENCDDDRFDKIKERVKTRTWKNWRERYNKRFEKFFKC